MGKYISTDPRINLATNHVTAITGQESGAFLGSATIPP